MDKATIDKARTILLDLIRKQKNTLQSRAYWALRTLGFRQEADAARR